MRLSSFFRWLIRSKPKARVARLQLCDCKRNWTDPHLTIELDHISLQHGDATAISYVWGEFDRRDVPIGHPPGKSDDVIHMNLGIEWVTQDVIHRLAEIAADKPIWMDQLCIPQNDEEIRRILASIATIYRTFEVAVLLPGHPCACLPRIVKELEARGAKTEKDHTTGGDDDTELHESHLCLNVCPLSSWMSRLWTFQELGFSRSVCCVWVSKDVAKCIFLRNTLENISEPEDTRLAEPIAETDLQPYTAIWFRHIVSMFVQNGMDEYFAARYVWSHLHDVSFRFLVQISSQIEDFDPHISTSGWIDSIGAFGNLLLYRFISGEVIQRKEDPLMELNPSFKLFVRIPLLQRGLAMIRKATHARDYVIAIFAEVPGYSPPPNYKNEELPVLLQHALDWHRQESKNVVMLSTAPQGLFIPDAAESFLWRPAYYISPDRIRNANEVYQTLNDIVQLKKSGTCDVVPLSYQFAGCTPLSTSARSWESFHGHFADLDSVPEVAAQLHNVVQGWKWLGTNNNMLTLHEDMISHLSSGSVSDDTFQLQGICLTLMVRNDIQQRCTNLSPSMADLHLAFYELVCRALFLDAAFCWEKGVKLMFSPPTEYRQYTRVGLYRGDVKLGGEQVHDSDHIIAHKSLTVGIHSKRFEAERIDDHEGKPAYRVFGVWVRMEDDFEGDIGAVYDLDNPLIDAFLL